MAYFKETRERKQLTLPSDENYWVKVTTDLRYGERKHVVAYQEGGVDITQSVDNLMKTLIVEWNLDDEQGNVLPITPENIDKLTEDDAAFIINQVAETIEKKDKEDEGKKEFVKSVITALTADPDTNPLIPDELIEYQLCKEFGWTITELYEQPAETIQRFILISNAKHSVQQVSQQEAEEGIDG